MNAIKEKIKTMTPEQESQLEVYRQRARSWAYRTKPLDQSAVEDVITKLYAKLGKEKPMVVYATSPWQMCMLGALWPEPKKLKELYSQLSSQLDSQLSSQLSSQLDSQLYSQLYSQLSSQLYSQLSSQLDSQLYSQLRSQLSSQLDSQLRSQLYSQLSSQLYSQLDSQLSSQLDSQLDSQLSSQLDSQLYSQLYSQLDSQLSSQLSSQLDSQLSSQLSSQLDSQLSSQLYSQLYSQLSSQLSSRARSIFNCRWATNWWTWWTHYYSFARDVLGVVYRKGDSELLDFWHELAQNVHMFSIFDGVCFISDFPTKLDVDEGFRLHAENEPALEYADGYALFSWHGVRVDWEHSDIITRPDSINADRIDAETNQELKRVMLERFTAERYIKEGGARLIHRSKKLPGVIRGKGERFKNPTTELYKKAIKGTDLEATFVRVINSTPEPDGVFKEYWLEVHPELRPIDPITGEVKGEPQEMTGWNAIASTWGLRGEEYYPLVET